MQISDADFETIVAKSIDRIPDKYGKHINNLAFIVENEPTQHQRAKLHLHNGQTLFGLYEGVPLTRRGSYGNAIPDKITIFKTPICYMSRSLDDLVKRVEKTIWHEVAHFFGLDHDDIDTLEQK